MFVIFILFSLPLSWKTRTRNWTEKWRTCRPGTVLPPLLHYSYLNTVYLKNYTGKKIQHYLISNYGYNYCITKIIFVFYISGCSYTHNTVLFHGKGLYVYRSIFNVVLHLSGKPFFISHKEHDVYLILYVSMFHSLVLSIYTAHVYI